MYEWHCKMERAELLIIVFLGVLIFLSECPTGSVAARICPLRAEPVYPAQENGIVRCACARPFFGKNCRYKRKMNATISGLWFPPSTRQYVISFFLLEQNGTIALNATRLTEKTVLMKWKENAETNEERRYLISVRKVEFKLPTVKLHKWQKASIEYINPSSTLFKSQQETESRDDLSQKKMYNDYTAVLRLPGTSSYEVKITTLTTAGKHVGSTSVFFDASDAFVNGEWEWFRNKSNKIWIYCYPKRFENSFSGTMLGISEKMDNFKNYLFDSFEDACALKGIVIGVVVGSLGTLMIIAMVYVLSRYYNSKHFEATTKKTTHNQ